MTHIGKTKCKTCHLDSCPNVREMYVMYKSRVLSVVHKDTFIYLCALTHSL